MAAILVLLNLVFFVLDTVGSIFGRMADDPGPVDPVERLGEAYLPLTEARTTNALGCLRARRPADAVRQRSRRIDPSLVFSAILGIDVVAFACRCSSHTPDPAPR